MQNKILENRLGKEKPLSEEAIFREYMAYVNGSLPDELGERGRRIMSDADTVSRLLGYPDIQSWINSYNLDNSSASLIKNSSTEKIEKLREDYKQLSSLGYGLRDINKAISVIEINRNMYGIRNGDSLFLKSYEEKKKIVSQAKKYCKEVLYPKE